MSFKQLVAAVTLSCFALIGRADFPDRPLTIVVPFAAGSATDQLTRSLASGLTSVANVPVVIDNKAGASGMIGAQSVARAPKDGYTLLISTSSTHGLNESLFRKLPYDPAKDFEPIAMLAVGSQVLIVRNDLGVNSVADLVAMAKANPGKLNYGYGSTSSQIAGELFKQMTQTFIVPIPYRSNPAAVTDLMGGRIDMMIVDLTSGLSQAKAGKVRALAVSTKARMGLAPELPTISEAGVKGYEASFWCTISAPAGTPPNVIARLHEMVAKANRAEASVRYYEKNGFDLLEGSPEQTRQFHAAETVKFRTIAEKAGIEKE